jgi:hypothetical protein
MLATMQKAIGLARGDLHAKAETLAIVEALLRGTKVYVTRTRWEEIMLTATIFSAGLAGYYVRHL